MKPEPTQAAPVTSGTTVEYQVRFATGPKGKKGVRPGAEVVPVVQAVPAPPVIPRPRPTPPRTTPVAPPSRTVAIPTSEVPSATRAAPRPRVPKIALLLTLTHHFERLVNDGRVKDYAELARVTGLTRARVTQIMNLLLLAPDIQEAILDLRISTQGEDPVHERSFRTVVAEPDWGIQRFLLSRLRVGNEPAKESS